MPHISSMNLESGSQLSAQYRVPFKGVVRVRPVHHLGADELYDGQNMVIRHAELRPRAGLAAQMIDNHTAKLTGVPLAGITFVSQNLKAPTVLTTDAVWQFVNEQWINLGNITPTATRDAPGSLTTLEANNQVYLIISNGVSPLRWWSQQQVLGQIPANGSAGTPTFRDMCTAANRIVGIRLPYTVQWSQFLAPDQWRASNVAILADTEDEVVAIRSLGTLGFVVYKVGSIFVGFTQAGSDANAFKFEHFGQYEGPANNQAIVDVGGTHIYMTPSGRIGAFDGSQQSWIADGIWPLIANDLDPHFVSRICVSYTYLHNEVTFYYPRLGDTGACRGLVTLNLPYPQQGIEHVAPFNGLTHLDSAACLSIRLFQGDRNPWVFDAEGFVYKSNGEAYDDAGEAFACVIHPGLHTSQPDQQQGQQSQQSQQASIFKATLELYALRDDTRGLIELFEVHSGLLQQPGGIVEPKSLTLDLSRFVASNQFYGFTSADTYLGFRIEHSSDSRLHYYGANFYMRAII